jgi:hypothetical protein
MATSTLQKKTDELEAIKKMKAFQAKLKTAKSEKAKAALQSKIKEINDTLKKGTSFKDLTAKQVANAKLASRKKFLEMSKKDFNAVIRTLAKKSEYAFLKNMSRPEIERDIKRKAKPVGWRFKGRGDYRTPTAAQARKGRANGTVYYENRPNKSDVSQSKQLAKGGMLEHGLQMGDTIVGYGLGDGTVVVDGHSGMATVNLNTGERFKQKMKDGGGVTPMSLADIKAMRDAEYDYDPNIDDSDLEDDKIVRYYFEEEAQYAEKGGGISSMKYAIIVTNTNNPYDNQSRVALVGRKGDAVIMLSALQIAAKAAPLDYKIVELKEKGGGIKGAAKRGAEKAKEAGDDVADWAFNFDPKKKYNDGGEVNINDLDLPVHYTMFEDEMYEYGQGGSTYEVGGKKADKMKK